MNNRRTVRLSDDQTEQVAKIADYLHITESQVLRAGIDQMWIGYGEEAERFAVEAARLRENPPYGGNGGIDGKQPYLQERRAG